MSKNLKKIEKQIQETEKKIEEAVSKRDYKQAEILQTQLDELNYNQQQIKLFNSVDNKSQQLQELEEQRLNEETEVQNNLNEKTEKLLNEAYYRLQQIKERHASEIASLASRFNNPLFGTVRLSPNVQSLRQAEKYYVKKRDYKMANLVKAKITETTQQELNQVQSMSNNTIQAKISTTVKKHSIELQGFRDKLENDKNNLKLEATHSILRIHNKYLRLRHAVLGNSNDPYSKRTINEEAKDIYLSIDNQFKSIIEQCNINYSSANSSMRSNSQQSCRQRDLRVQKALEKSVHDIQVTNLH